MIHLGFDIGSSFIKAVMWDSERNQIVARSSWPEHELPIRSDQPGWAEQDPSMWWDGVCALSTMLLTTSGISPHRVEAIGISAQMHGLVLLDSNGEVLRPSLLWCDGRAVDEGKRIESVLGASAVSERLFNSPGNFTISKLAWVVRHQPDLVPRIRWVMLPSDYIAYKLTGSLNTTACSLSEAMMWDLAQGCVHESVIRTAGAQPSWIPPIVPAIGNQGTLTTEAAHRLGLHPAVRLHFRAGDQPANAFALGVDRTRDIAMSAGTSGVVYRFTEQAMFDRTAASNLFVHVDGAFGQLLCVNGTGIAYSWLKKTVFPWMSYAEMNSLAETAPVGSDGLRFLPFGNGAERLFGNRIPGAGWQGLDFNRHGSAHLVRSVLEGIACSLTYALDCVRDRSAEPHRILAPRAGLFQSSLFCAMIANLTGCNVELHDTDGALGAAQGPLRPAPGRSSDVVLPNPALITRYEELYVAWKLTLHHTLK